MAMEGGEGQDEDVGFDFEDVSYLSYLFDCHPLCIDYLFLSLYLGLVSVGYICS